MKHFKQITLLLLFLLINIGCSEDKNNSQTISGMWSLIQTTGTIAGIEHNFVEGTIIWTFNSNKTLTILNNNEDENLQSGLSSGTYTYTIGNNPADANSLPECAKYIIIDDFEFTCLILSDQEMKIREGISDGVNYHFIKINPNTTYF